MEPQSEQQSGLREGCERVPGQQNVCWQAPSTMPCLVLSERESGNFGKAAGDGAWHGMGAFRVGRVDMPAAAGAASMTAPTDFAMDVGVAALSRRTRHATELSVPTVTRPAQLGSMVPRAGPKSLGAR